MSTIPVLSHLLYFGNESRSGAGFYARGPAMPNDPVGRALCDIGGEEVARFVAPLLFTDDMHTKRRAINVLLCLDSVESRAALQRDLQTEKDPGIRALLIGRKIPE